MNEIIRLADIEKSFGTKHVLKNINIRVEGSFITGLIGQSGSGKSTMAKILAGLVNPDAGKILYMNKEIGHAKKRSFTECADIQYIFQDPYSSVEGTHTVKQVLEEAGRLCRLHKRMDVFSPAKAMDMVGMDYAFWMNRRVATLSGGQRQRLCLARAILPKPKLVIADESTAMLDNETALEIFRLLEGIRSKYGIAVFLITHQAEVIKEICDYLYVLYEGKIVEAGKKNEVLSSPKADYTKRMLECIDYMGGAQFG